MTGSGWRNKKSFGRCDRKQTYRTGDKAYQLAMRNSKKTGELIISYKCFDCGKWHLGHADQSQIIVRQQDARPTCEYCGKAIPPFRVRIDKLSQTVVKSCSTECAKLRARYLKQQRRAARQSSQEPRGKVLHSPERLKTIPSPPSSWRHFAQ